MVNNKFSIIGVAITDFKKLERTSANIYEAIIELDKRSTGYNQVPIRCFESNNGFDVHQSICGKTVIIDGFIDTYVKDTGNGQVSYINLFANSIYVIGRVNNQYAAKAIKVEENVKPKAPETFEISPDDLPF